jgi:imidazolonepropionase-like amidohydrolase
MTVRRSHSLGPRRVSAAWPAVALLSLALAAGAADQPRYAIRAGKIVTITRGVINHGVVLVRDGKIEALGPADRLKVPSGYTVIDADDEWVMPGMVEIHSHCSLGGTGWGINDTAVQTNPGLRVGDGVDPEAEVSRAALAVGITTIQTLPGSGTNHGGFGVVYKTAGATKEERLIRRVSVMKIAQAYNPERPAGDIGRSRMGMTWLLRDLLTRERAYNAAWSDYESHQRPDAPERDLSLEFARGVFQGKLPVIIHTCQSWGLLMTLAMFHDEFGTSAIVTHGEFGAYRAAGEVAKRGVPVNVGPRMVDFGDTAEGRFRGLVAEYADRGVKDLSVNTDAFGLDQTHLAKMAAVSVRLGYDEAQGLSLVTINPARAILLGDRLGSIEVGKDADLVVKRSSLLDPTTPVEMVFVNGKLAYRRPGSR